MYKLLIDFCYLLKYNYIINYYTVERIGFMNIIIKKVLAMASSVCLGVSCTMSVAATESVSENRFDISFIGDSICETGNWAELFPDANITNFGVGGEDTDEILARFESACGDYDKMVITCGVNDWDVEGWSEGTYSGSMSNFENMFRIAKEKMPDIQIYVTGILPTCKNYARYIKNNITPVYNAKLKALCEEYDYVTFMGECWDVLIDAETGIGNLNLYRDGLHPNKNGFSALKTVMEPYIYEKLPTKPNGNVYYQYKDNNSAIRFVAEVSVKDVTTAQSGKYEVTLNGETVRIWDITKAFRSIYAGGELITASEGNCFVISNILTGYEVGDEISVDFSLDNYDKGISRTIILT